MSALPYKYQIDLAVSPPFEYKNNPSRINLHRTEVTLRFTILSLFVLISFTGGNGQVTRHQSPGDDLFSELMRLTVQHVPSAEFTPAIATDDELREWGRILTLFRRGARDSCRAILQKYNYRLTEMHDPTTGETYDFFKENHPVQRGWGTFVYNRNHKKRLYIQVTHPVDDSNTPAIGGELLRRLNGEWLFIAGTSKSSQNRSLKSTLRARWTVFHRWHEMLTDLTHLTISLHGFNAVRGRTPDIIVSNGRTSDEQWGISQISMAFRDSMRAAGFNCMLAMYDSGYAKLAGRSSQEGIFSNDSVGFGHWLNLELSSAVRGNGSLQKKLLVAADRALELTGSKVSRQMNRAFGLVSPRVVRIDSTHRILFPPPGAETYRIVSFNASEKRKDTIDIRMGNWLGAMRGQKSITTVTRLDSVNDIFSRSSQRRELRGDHSRIFGESDLPMSAMVQFNADPSDSALLGDADPAATEPLQIHRIPLTRAPVPAHSGPVTHRSTPFSWNGLVSQFGAATPFFQRSGTESELNNSGLSARFLIPIINNTFRGDERQFIGIEMTDVLVGEIARLVSEHEMTAKDIGLLAERSEGGDYYLRIFPGNSSTKNFRKSY